MLKDHQSQYLYYQHAKFLRENFISQRTETVQFSTPLNCKQREIPFSSYGVSKKQANVIRIPMPLAKKLLPCPDILYIAKNLIFTLS